MPGTLARFGSAFVVLATPCLLVVACGVDIQGTCMGQVCAGATSSHAGSSPAPDGGSPAPDPAPAPKDGGSSVPEVVTPAPDPDLRAVEGAGIFVSHNTGQDTNPGTPSAPVRTIAQGIALASALGPRRAVFICSATYTENVVLGPAQDGMQLLGGYTCPGEVPPAWTPSGIPAVVAPTLAGKPALRIDGLKAGALIRFMQFMAPSAEGTTGQSSIAAHIVDSGLVTLRRVGLKSSDGAPGEPGIAGSDGSQANYSYDAPAGTQGGGSQGGAAVVCACKDGTTTVGGKGGDGGGGPKSLGESGKPALSGGGGAAGSCAPGEPGANGSPGAGGRGASTSGNLSGSAWNPLRAGSGANGNPGQGGGGGGGSFSVTPESGAGSGGCGGCGGAGGSGGQSGGLSAALVSVDSRVAFDGCILMTGNGGAGGKGGDGQAGQKGGKGGFGAMACQTGTGGDGGQGGSGGGGGGGAGGASVGVLYVGTPPNLGGATPQLGFGGVGGQGGLPSGAEGATGLRRDVWGL